MLYIVPTPIGNLEDITLRALRVLREADVIACEDTRTSAVLLNHYAIETPTLSYHEHNERARTPGLVKRMQAGETIALISDAGTPGISDPAFYLVRACLELELPVVALPGPTAFVPALVASGLPTHRFCFEGFLPPKKGRATRLRALAEEERTVVLYESPHRLDRTLRDLIAVCGAERPAAVAREISKKFEEVRKGALQEIQAHYQSQARVKGECVIVLGGKPDPERTAASP